MKEIADHAGISKSLLFYYFHNKKELYLFLWEYAADVTLKYLNEYKCYEHRLQHLSSKATGNIFPVRQIMLLKNLIRIILFPA